MKKAKVVANAYELSVLELIHTARTPVQNVADNATIFINPNPALSVISIATDDYEAAAWKLQMEEKQRSPSGTTSDASSSIC